MKHKNYLIDKKMIKRIAIIPARGGSKRIPEKNIKDFCGKPIISYSIEALRESKLFQKIHVSTEDQKIIETVNQLGLEVDFLRPCTLSDDHTPIMPVIKYVVERYLKMNQSFEEIWVIFPCSPLLKVKDLIQASIQFNRNHSFNTLMTVTEYPVPIEWAFEINKEGVLVPIRKGNFAIRSQDLNKRYYDAGMFYIYTKDVIFNLGSNGSDENIIPYFISKGSAIDIDDEQDWQFAEKLFKLNKK